MKREDAPYCSWDMHPKVSWKVKGMGVEIIYKA